MQHFPTPSGLNKAIDSSRSLFRSNLPRCALPYPTASFDMADARRA
jgi:hypothetical protein